MQEAGSIYFKKCCSSDITLLQEISIKSYKENYTYLWEDEGEAYMENFYNKTMFEADINNSDCSYYLIYRRSEPAGFFKIRNSGITLHDPVDCLELNKIYILDSFKGKGLGSKTLSFIIELAASMNRTILWLNVMEKSKAKDFYEQKGFELVKSTSLNYPHMKEGLNVLCTYKKQITKF